MSYKKYDPEELKHLQQVELMILKDIIDVCEKNNITYFIYGGSALGAVRHGGFIPWDDDVDLIMFREDYEKFFEIAQTQLNNRYELLAPNLQEDYYLPFLKVSLKGTKFQETVTEQVSYNQGIFVDIFILDNVPESDFKRKLHSLKCRLLNVLVLNSEVKFKNKNVFKRYFQYALYYFLKTFSLRNFLKKRLYKNVTKYKDNESELVIDHGALCGIVFYDREDFGQGKTVKFGDLNVKVPVNVDRILTQIYGDYMQLPPEDKRYNHAPVVLDFGEY